MVKKLFLKKKEDFKSTTIDLPSSKSESNRALIIQAFAQKQGKENIHLSNISEANDTKVLLKLLASNHKELDVEDAGTTMRFLTAFLAFSGQEKSLTGTARMQERPIEILVESLNKLGANIRYIQNIGFPPIHILPKTESEKDIIEIQGNISSQYISALLMLAPTLKNGLRLILQGEVKSKPYIQMTLDLMAHFGISYIWDNNQIMIQNQNYSANTYTIQADWSAASYFYSLVGIEKNQKVLLKNLRKDSLQGDKKTAELAEYFGVKSEFTAEGTWLFFEESLVKKELPILDFSDCPDLAQTFVVWASATQEDLWLTGLESLKIKETDRILALQTELQKFNISLEEKKEKLYFLDTSKANFNHSVINISTYEDHRMAMAFAALAVRTPLIIENPSVVSKSFPSFWENIERMGFELKIK